MSKIKRLSIIMLITILMSVTVLQVSASVKFPQNQINARYLYDFNSHKFIPENEFEVMNTRSVNNVINTAYDITIDGDPFTVKVLSCNQDTSMTNSIPYTHLDRVMSIANGQTQTESNTDTYKKTSQVSHTTLNNISFNHERSALLEVAKGAMDVAFNLKASFSKSVKRTNTQKSVYTESKTETVEYNVPNNATDCNSVDYYTFAGMKVFDVEVELIDNRYTSNPVLGYTEVIDTEMEFIYDEYNQNIIGLKCGYCGQPADVGPSLQAKHVVFADGHVAHLPDQEFDIICELENYKPYSLNNKTTMTFKYYQPLIYVESKAWYKDGNNQLALNKPLHMVAPGTEEIFCTQNKKYLFRIVESPLRTNFVTNYPGIEAKHGSPVADGMTKTVEFKNEIKTSNSSEKVVTTNYSVSANVKQSFLKWASLSYGASYSNTTIDSNYQEVEKTISYYSISKFKLPTAFENDYTGMHVMETKDIFTYACVIIGSN